jgi:hypothetical protein
VTIVTLIGLMAFFFHVLNERSTVAPPFDPFEPFVTLAVVQSVERHGVDFPWCDQKNHVVCGLRSRRNWMWPMWPVGIPRLYFIQRL